MCGLDLIERVLGLVHIVDKGQGDAFEFDNVELGEQRVAEHFHRNASSVGDKKSSASVGHGGSRWRANPVGRRVLRAGIEGKRSDGSAIILSLFRTATFFHSSPFCP